MTSAIFQRKGNVPVTKDALIIDASVGGITGRLSLSALLKRSFGFVYIPRYEMQIVLIHRAFLA